MKLDIIKNTATGAIDVIINGINVGIIDEIDLGHYSYFPKRNDQITGDHLIEIGKALNKINGIN